MEVKIRKILDTEVAFDLLISNRNEFETKRFYDYVSSVCDNPLNNYFKSINQI